MYCELTKIISASHPSPTVLIPALRTVGNIVTGDDAQTQVLVNCLIGGYHHFVFCIGNLFNLFFSIAFGSF